MKAGIGGKIQGISLDSFLQVVQMDRMTCTIKVTAEEGAGTLYFVKGEIFSAVTGDKHNAEAACQIISWEDSVIEIEEICDKTENEIVQPLMNILMEAMRLRDEAKVEAREAPSQKEKPDTGEPRQTEKQGPAKAASPPKPKAAGRSRRRLPWVVGGGIACLLGLLSAAYFVQNRMMAQAQYSALLTRVAKTIPLNEKRELLQAYIHRHPGGKLASDAGKRLSQLHQEIDARRLSDVENRAALLLKKEDPEGALALFEKLEKSGLSGTPEATARRKITELKTRIDTRAYARLMAATEGKGPEQRMDVYQHFLKSYPDSPHRQVVDKLISKMSQAYYYYTENQIFENEKEQNWDACLRLSQRYIDIYPGSENADTLREYQALCRQEKKDALAFQALVKRAGTFGDNYTRMIHLYTDYLKAHPQSHARAAIKKEIAKVKALAEKKRIASAADEMRARLSKVSNRFTVNGDGTVSDTQTGLMWCLLDSTTVRNRCLDFGEAQQYVAGLTTGGHTDWRLPTKKELTALYYKKPAFPSSGPTWYWTNQTYKKYIGRWMIDVDVVTTETKPEKEVENKASWHCGAVRAVRGGKKRRQLK